MIGGWMKSKKKNNLEALLPEKKKLKRLSRGKNTPIFDFSCAPRSLKLLDSYDSSSDIIYFHLKIDAFTFKIWQLPPPNPMDNVERYPMKTYTLKPQKHTF